MPTNRLQISFSRTPVGKVEDVAVITSHWHDGTGNLLSGTGMAFVENSFATFWNTMKVYAPTYIVPKEFRWYDQQVPGLTSPLLRVTPAALSPGTGTGAPLPPQCAISCTLETAFRHRWGRFYMPGPMGANLDVNAGRMTTANVDAIAGALSQLISVPKASGYIATVWSPRGGGSGAGTFPAGSTTDITGVRVDDIVDIIRSRRWQDSPYRKHFAIP